MNQTKCDLLIIGAGLTGLTLAYYLRNSNASIKILEARDRIGGRIETLQETGFPPMEMGATWLGQKHTALRQLLKELQLEIFEQQMGSTAIYEPISTSPPQIVQLPPNDAPSFRIKGGSATVIQQLAKAIENSCSIHLKQPVLDIKEEGDQLLVKTATHTFEASRVISTLPPYLLLKSITFQPSLPTQVRGIMQSTHTWMGESIKVGLYFEQPFWRTNNLSGTIVSNVGPIPEMYDHSNFEDKQFALKGFLNGSYFSLSKEDRLALILKQLRKYYGTQVDTFIRYEEKVWRKEPYTFAPYEAHVLPHQYNGHPIYQASYYSGKLYIAGSETATAFPGYMDGAVGSARFVAEQLISMFP